MNKLHNTFYQLIDIRFADPVSALGMNEKYVALGTMMGRISVLSLVDKKILLLAELSSENITGITFEAVNTFNVAVGDFEILKYKFNLVNGQISPDFYRMTNTDENSHKADCDATYTLLSNKHVLLIKLLPTDENNISIKTEKKKVKVDRFITIRQRLLL
jgi:hypothetical protein